LEITFDGILKKEKEEKGSKDDNMKRIIFENHI
jgi:hypothetical protein